MKGLNDVSILLTFLIFLSTFAFIQAAFGTEILRSRPGWDANVAWTSNETSFGTSTEILPPPPVCIAITQNYVPIISEIIDGTVCVAGYLAWMVSLMYIESSVQWFYQLILFPILCVMGLIIIRTLKSGGG